MKHNNEIVALALVFLLGAVAGNAQAATAIGDYDLHGAPVDPLFYNGGGGHAVWFSQGTNDYVFAPGAGNLTEYDDGTARINGTVYSITQPSEGFTIELFMTGRTLSPPDGSPKKELASTAYVENGGPVDTSTWTYYQSFTGTFTGVGSLTGTDYTITPRGPAFQIGVGASGKNVEFGAAAWFIATDDHGNERHGDLNLNVSAVPVPAALPLMLSALVALGLRNRRNQS